MVRMTVFDAQGQTVANLMNGEMETGWNAVSFDAASLSSGMYSYSLNAGAVTETRKW